MSVIQAMDIHRFFNCLAVVALLLVATPGWPQAVLSPEWRELRDISILVHEGGLATDQSMVPGVARVLVRLVDGEGRIVADQWSDHGVLEVRVEALPDGLYRWDVLSVVDLDPVAWTESLPSGRRTVRSSGTLEVRDGAVLLQHTPGPDAAALPYEGASRSSPGLLLRMAGQLLDWLSGTAHASQTVTDYVRIKGDYSQVLFKDTTDDDTPFSSDWAIYADDFLFKVADSYGFDVLNFSRNAAQNALVVDGNGDMTLQNGLYVLDRDQPRIGINRIPNSLGGNLQIEDLAPTISLWDPDAAGGPQQMLMHFDDGIFGIWSTDLNAIFDVVNLDMTAPGNSLELTGEGDLAFSEAVYVDRSGGSLGIGRWPVSLGGQLQVEAEAPWLSLHKPGSGFAQMNYDGEYVSFGKAIQIRGETGFLDRVRFSMAASGGALVLDSNGNLGLGGNTSGASLEVRRTDGSAQIHVNEGSAAAAPRTLFRLSNAGNTKFEIEETASGNSWAFTNSGNDFRVSLQNSGVVEFRVDNAGDAFLAGALTENSDVNAKQAIRPVNPELILSLVEALPVSRWQYRDAPGVDHLGPMAQDFHAAFGLGASDTGISTIDTAGVALAAIQALALQLRESSERQAQLAQDNLALAGRNARLESRLARLEQRTEQLASMLGQAQSDHHLAAVQGR